MAEFNLIEERWIPCIDLKGRNVECGIRKILLKAHRLREICDDSPLVTVAIHRLLLAILYRAFKGPRSFTSLKVLCAGGAFDAQTVNRYLDKWKEGFDLFGERKPFYQMAGLETRRPISVNRLATECASGNNETLFDHCGDDVVVEWSRAQTAKQLIACQSFALGFGKSGNATIDGVEEVLPYSADAIALRGMCIWLQGKSLFETLVINLVPVDLISSPPWELENPNEYRDRLRNKKREVALSYGVVDRLTWQSRLVRLIPKGSAVSQMYFTQGRSLDKRDKSAGDPMKVYQRSSKEGITALPLSSSKAAWRDAHAILTIPGPESNEHRPDCFNVAARLSSVLDTSNPFAAQIVGLASAPNKAGKFLLWRHDRMPVPAALLGSDDLIERLGGLIQQAEQLAKELRTRTRRMSKLYLAPDCESPGGRQPDPDEVKRMVQALDPRPAYWARLEEHFFGLLENLPSAWDETSGDWKPDGQQDATRTWRDNIKKEAQRAVEESISSIGTTARAIKAIARVRTDFHDDDLSPSAQSVDKRRRERRKEETSNEP